ncbi:MAG: hypothetical protein M1832_003819 [Thelocarpon impressellum]|nr:MAG: hypothetical protein M1832_003819 [Thelocarpon impressellum]
MSHEPARAAAEGTLKPAGAVDPTSANGSRTSGHTSSRRDADEAAMNSSQRPPTPPRRTSSRAGTRGADGGDPRRAGESSQFDAGASDGQEKDRSRLEVPTRSGHQPSPSSAFTGATAIDPAEAAGRVSTGSTAGKRRRGGSVASSRRTASAQRQAANDAGDPRAGEDQRGSARASRPKKGGLSRFFSFMNCCGVPDHGNSVDAEGPAVPAKPTSQLQGGRVGRQEAPLIKQDPEGQGSSTADSKDAVDEKLAGIRDSENTDVSAESHPPKDNPAQDGSTDPAVAQAKTTSRENRGDDGRPAEGSSRLGSGVRDHEAAQSSEVQGGAQLPNPSHGTSSASSVPISATSKQASDVDMPDAPPPPGDDVSSEPSRRESTSTRTDLPPPPPAQRRASTSLGNGQATPDALVPGQSADKQQWLLPPLQPRFKGKKCLVLDLDETLVHSSFKILHQADFTIPVEIEGQFHNVYVIKRPGVDQFMKRVGELYEVVVFTASVSKYGDPLLDQLDIHNVVHHRLFRESCYNHQGNYVKDLSQVGRDLRETIIIDNSPTSYIFHPQHAVPISSWFSDAHDNELLDLIPVLEDLAGPQVQDVSLVLDVAL